MDDKKQRLMVVDDDKVLLKNAAVLLGVNYSVSLYSGGREALEALSDKALPDLILLDVRMPDIDGYSVIIEIKSMPKCRNIPVVFVTGMSDEEDEDAPAARPTQQRGRQQQPLSPQEAARQAMKKGLGGLLGN